MQVIPNLGHWIRHWRLGSGLRTQVDRALAWARSRPISKSEGSCFEIFFSVERRGILRLEDNMEMPCHWRPPLGEFVAVWCHCGSSVEWSPGVNRRWYYSIRGRPKLNALFSGWRGCDPLWGSYLWLASYWFRYWAGVRRYGQDFTPHSEGKLIYFLDVVSPIIYLESGI